MILHRGIPNGFLKENPHGIEQLNTIPDAIQEMMLQSHEGVIRIFPVWPRKSIRKQLLVASEHVGLLKSVHP